MKEESITFSVSGSIFYNPDMRMCRSISSLALGAIEGSLEVVDAFCASGIRGIRYATENENVSSLKFIDIERKAISLAKKNSKVNSLKSDAVVGNISKVAFEHDADFLEIDPFGTPSPYLVDAFRFFNTKKSAYLSVTATDVAVLCGGRIAACMKNYHSRPMNNEFTHENGLRIMMKKIAETAAEFNMGIRPLISFSDKHYLKSILAVKRSADLAYDSMRSLGFISFCEKCGFREAAAFPRSCGFCGSATNYSGPLWLGELHEKGFVSAMLSLNEQRDYADREQIKRMLATMHGEVGMPPYYYNVHELCKRAKSTSVPTMDTVLDSLRSSGYAAVRTHFSPVSIKSDAPHKTILEAVGWKG